MEVSKVQFEASIELEDKPRADSSSSNGMADNKDDRISIKKFESKSHFE